MATDKSLGLKVEGLEAVVKQYRKAGPEVNALLKIANKRFAEETVELAKARVYARVPGRQASAGRPSGKGSISRTRASMRANATAKGASIIGGGPKAPAFFGHEFGGQARPETRQFALHRGRQGYFLYPAIRSELPDAEKRWNAIIDEVFSEGTAE